MERLSVVCDLVHQHWGDKTISIGTGYDEQFAPEWCSFTSLYPSYPFTREELMIVYHLATDYVCIKYDIITIPHL